MRDQSQGEVKFKERLKSRRSQGQGEIEIDEKSKLRRD